MSYKKVFTKTRFHTKARNNFRINHKARQIIVGAKDVESQTAFVGKVIEQGKTSTLLDYEVLCDVSFPHVVGIFGNRGSGKSFDLGVFLEEIYLDDKRRGSVDNPNAAIVFDVQDQFWTLAYEPIPGNESDIYQLAELDRWGLSQQKISELSIIVPSSTDTQVPDAVEFSLGAQEVSESDLLSILDLERFSPMGQALLTLISAHGRIPPDQLASMCKNQGILSGFQPGTVDGLRWRLDSLSEVGIIQEAGVSVDDFLLPGKLTIVLMRNLSDSVRALVVGVISRLVADRMGRVQQTRKVARRTGLIAEEQGSLLAKKVWLVLDEAHVLVPSDALTPATDPLIDYVKRGRDAGLSLVFATQQPSAVNSKLMSQVDMTITHMLGFEADLNAAVNRMPTRNSIEYDVDSERVVSIGDVIRSLEPGEAVLADGASGRILLIKVRPRRTAHGGETPS